MPQKSKQDKHNYNQAYYKANHEKCLKQVRAYRKRIRDMAFNGYGGYVCACCGEAEDQFLCIDHVAGDGNAHRKAIGKSSGTGFYSWLVQNSWPIGFQVLCYNCNNGREKNNGICPHKIHKEKPHG